MSVDISFQYPPDLMNLLIDTIPLLNKSKQSVFLFFQGAGVSASDMAMPKSVWQQDKTAINKFEIVRQVLTKLNSNGESSLRERREILKRVVEFEQFSVCWENDRYKAKGLVSEIQAIINVKDSFTRMNKEREEERMIRVRAVEARKGEIKKKQEAIEHVKQELYGLFAESNPQRRGIALEGILNRLFEVCGIGIRQAFALTGESGEGVIEQIDGVVEIDGHVYCVEFKWWRDPIGVPEVSQHLVRVYQRAESRAIIISSAGFTEPAVATCKLALSQKVVVLCTLEEIVKMLEAETEVEAFFKRKVQAAIIEKNPFHSFSAGANT